MDSAALAELAQSIREHGVLQPLIVTTRPDGTYQLITGERRWRAARLAGLLTIPAVVKEAAPRMSLEIALVENIQRRDLNAFEEAQAYLQLVQEYGMTQEALAQRVGRSRTAIANTLRLLHLPDPARAALLEGSISEGHARAILAVHSEPQQLALLERMRRDNLTVRQAEQLARVLAEEPPTDDLPSSPSIVQEDPDVNRMEDAFRQALGTRVRLVRGRHGGRLVIHFYSDEELQGLYEAIVRT
jgi:ParB family chromosome partitioning protein